MYSLSMGNKLSMHSHQRLFCFANSFFIWALLLFLSGCQSPPNLVSRPALAPQAQLPASCESGQRQPAGYSCRSIFQGQVEAIEPLERFSKRLDILRKDVSGRTSDLELLNAFATDDSRTVTLHLQALGKIYEIALGSHGDRKAMTKFREEVKFFEGQSGDYMRLLTLKKLINSEKLPPAFAQALEKKLRLEEATAIAKFRKAGWIPDPLAKIAKLEKNLQKIDFQKIKKDRKAMLTAMIEYVDETRDSVRNLGEVINKPEYEEADLEAGVHNLRRKLRWVALLARAADGVFVFAPNDDRLSGRLTPPEEKSALAELEDLYGDSKYIDLQPPDPLAIEIDRPAMLDLVKLVTELGAIKDYKESYLDFVDFIMENQLAENRGAAEVIAERAATAKFGAVEVEKTGEASYQYYLAKDPLKRLRASLRRALDQ
jgi:hypothetical protein